MEDSLDTVEVDEATWANVLELVEYFESGMDIEDAGTVIVLGRNLFEELDEQGWF